MILRTAKTKRHREWGKEGELWSGWKDLARGRGKVGKELPLSSWEEKSLGRMGVSLEIGREREIWREEWTRAIEILRNWWFCSAMYLERANSYLAATPSLRFIAHPHGPSIPTAVLSWFSCLLLSSLPKQGCPDVRGRSRPVSACFVRPCLNYLLSHAGTKPRGNQPPLSRDSFPVVPGIQDPPSVHL